MSEHGRAEVTRRGLLVGAGAAGLGSTLPLTSAGAETDPVLAGRPLVRYPEKTDLILLTARPPQLETPMRYFDRAITPNEAFFRHVDRSLSLSMDDLRTKFPRASVTAVAQCSGNSRGRFAPRVLGGQWPTR